MCAREVRANAVSKDSFEETVVGFCLGCYSLHWSLHACSIREGKFHIHQEYIIDTLLMTSYIPAPAR